MTTPPKALKQYDSNLVQILLGLGQFITKTRLFKFIENFTTKKGKFSNKNSDIFHIPAQNIDCGCSLEPPQRGGSKRPTIYVFLAKKEK